MIKKERGITLVALVITIIVLLILAGVTIAMVVGDNGILSRSRQSKFESIKSEVEEKVKMAMADLAADMQTEEANNSSVEYNGSAVHTILKRTLGDNIQTELADKKYVIKVGNKVISSTSSDVVIPADPADGKITVSVEYQAEALKKSAKKDWTTNKLQYQYEIQNYLVTETTTDAMKTANQGGY